MITYSKKRSSVILGVCLLAVFAVLMFPLTANAATESGINGFDVSLSEDGNLIISGGDDMDFTEGGSGWATFYSKYRNIITAFGGVATITMLAAFIFHLTKLGVTAGDPNARRGALVGLLFTGIATAGLGSVTVIMWFFYTAL